MLDHLGSCIQSASLRGSDEVAKVKELKKSILSVSHGELPIFFGKNDKDNPRTWPTWKRVSYSIGPVMAAFVVALSNPLYTSSIPGLREELHVSKTLAEAGITMFACGLVLGPIISTSISEVVGRRIILLVSLVLCMVFTIVGGSATHFRTVLVARFFASFFGSSCATVPVGVLNDMWDIETEALGSFFVVLLVVSTVWAMSLGQTIGASVVTDSGNWRWTFWTSVIFFALAFVLIVPRPETYEPAILRTRAKKMGLPVPHRSLKTTVMISIGRPLHMLIVEPIVWPTCLYSGLTQAIVYCFYVAFPQAFEEVYHFSMYQVGLAFLPLFVGNVVAVPILIYLYKAKYERPKDAALKEGRPPTKPENRLYSSMVGSILLPISLFWLAWTARQPVHWIVPLLACIPFGTGYVLVILSLPIYKNDVYGTHFGASSLAADTMARYFCSAPIPLFTTQMINRMGFDWTITLLACFTILLLPVPWIIFKWGPKLRARSTYVRVAEIAERIDIAREEKRKRELRRQNRPPFLKRLTSGSGSRIKRRWSDV